MSRAPTSSAVSATMRPAATSASFAVPPPTSTLRMRVALADRARDRARTVGRHGGLEPVAGADGDELARLAREQFADGAGVAPPRRDPGEDQRAGVDVVGREARALVLALDEGAERGRVDRLPGFVGREQDVGMMERLAPSHDIAAVEPFEHDAREDEMRGRRTDIDADAHQANLVLERQGPAGVGKEGPAVAFRHRVWIIPPPSGPWRRARTTPPPCGSRRWRASGCRHIRRG